MSQINVIRMMFLFSRIFPRFLFSPSQSRHSTANPRPPRELKPNKGKAHVNSFLRLVIICLMTIVNFRLGRSGKMPWSEHRTRRKNAEAEVNHWNACFGVSHRFVCSILWFHNFPVYVYVLPLCQHSHSFLVQIFHYCLLACCYTEHSSVYMT